MRVEAAAPGIHATWTEDVQEASAALRAEVDAGGVLTAFRFEFISEAAYLANLAAGREGFAGAGMEEGSAGKEGVVSLTRTASGLKPETSYLYRATASNADGVAVGPVRRLTTRGSGPLQLLDDRGWEMVSPVDKNGGSVGDGSPAAGGGPLQAAAQGGAVTFSSASSFGGAAGAPAGSQYVARRLSTGWSTENVSPPSLGGGYSDPPEAPFQLFSADLSQGLLKGVADLPLVGSGAPVGYANFYLRSSSGSFTALLRQADVAGLGLAPGDFRLAFAGASPDLGAVVLSTCAALTADATEVPGAEGCDGAKPNLYEWSGSGLRLINLLPAQTTGTPGARLAAPLGAISESGARVYWTDGSRLYLREGERTVLVSESGDFQTATPDGAFAYFIEGEHLLEFAAGAGTAVDLTPAGGVRGVLGVSADGSRAYFATASGIFLAHEGAVIPVAAAPDTENFPPSAGVARVSGDGTRLLFLSRVELTPYDNTDVNTHEPDAELYLYGEDTSTLTCVSCNPTGERPQGFASIPGTTGPYRPRALAAGGRRIFFDTADALGGAQDTNDDQDVYEWEQGGVGTCTQSQGCLRLISSGRSEGGASFVDASADGADVFFLTDGSLVKSDPGAVDLYDAREGGGFPEPVTPIPCEEDACQPLPPPPDDPAPGTLAPSSGNPPMHFPKKTKKRHRKHHRVHAAHHRAGGRR